MTQAANPRFKLYADYRNYPFLAGLCRVASLPDNWDAAEHETGSPGYDPEKITELAEIMLDRAEIAHLLLEEAAREGWQHYP